MSNKLKFCYPENLSLIFELFQYDELCYCPEGIFNWKKKNFSVHGKWPNFSMRLPLRTRGKLMLVNLRLKIRAVWDSDIENQSSNFSHKKMLLAGKIYIRFLIYLKEHKMKKIDFSTLVTKLRFWSIFPDRRSYIQSPPRSLTFFTTSPFKMWGNSIWKTLDIL